MKIKKKKMFVKLRISEIEMVNTKFKSLYGMVVGKGIINNKRIIRMDDPLKREVVFYELID